eukprot:4281803-Lingulodinium_polyedra.AAC.1
MRGLPPGRREAAHPRPDAGRCQPEPDTGVTEALGHEAAGAAAAASAAKQAGKRGGPVAPAPR